MNDVMATAKSQPVPQEELDAYWRYQFVMSVLKYIETGQTAKFIAKKNEYSLVIITKEKDGVWRFSLGDSNCYSYRLRDVVEILETIYDQHEVIPLHGEFIISANHPKSEAK